MKRKHGSCSSPMSVVPSRIPSEQIRGCINLARRVADKCAGLPLALVVIARSKRQADFQLCIKLHDIMRGLALWIASDSGKNGNKWIIQDGRAIDTAKWMEAERVSNVVDTTELPHCPNLTTLMMTSSSPVLKMLRFDKLAALTSLHLQDTDNLIDFPSAPSSLRYLYIDLNRSHVKSIPKDLMYLTDLRYLIIKAPLTVAFPKGMISGMQTLELLDLDLLSLAGWKWLIEELGSIRGLKGLGMNLSVPDLENLSMIPCVPLQKLRIWESFWLMGCLRTGTRDSNGLHLPLRSLFPSCRSLQSLELMSFADNVDLVVAGKEEDQFGNLESLSFVNVETSRVVWKGVSPRVQFQNVSS